MRGAVAALALILAAPAGPSRAEPAVACDLAPLVAAARTAIAADGASSQVIEIASNSGGVQLTLVLPAAATGPAGQRAAPPPDGLSAEVEALDPDGTATLIGWRAAPWVPALGRQAVAALPATGTRLLVGPDVAVLLQRGSGRLDCAGVDLEGRARGRDAYDITGLGTATRDQLAALLLSGQGGRIAQPPPTPILVDLEAGTASGRAQAWAAKASPLANEINLHVGARQIFTTQLRLPAFAALDPAGRVTSDEVFYLSAIEESRPWGLGKMAPRGHVFADGTGRIGAGLGFGLTDTLSGRLGAAVVDDALALDAASLRLLHPLILGDRPALLTAEMGLLAADRPGIAGTMLTGDWRSGTGNSLSLAGSRQDGTTYLELSLAHHGRGIFGAEHAGVGLALLGDGNGPLWQVNGYLSVALSQGTDLRLSVDHSVRATRLAAGLRLPLSPVSPSSRAAGASPALPHSLRIDLGDQALGVRTARNLWEDVRASMYPEVATGWGKLLPAIAPKPQSD